METKNLMVMIITLVVGTILITGVLIPVISDSGSNSGSGSAADVLYYKAPVENEEHTYSVLTEYDDDFTSGTLKVLLDDKVIKEVEYTTPTDQNKRPEDVTIPILYGSTTTDMQGTEITVDYMFFASISYCWESEWSPSISIVNLGTATVMGSTNTIYDENNVTDTPYTINVTGDAVTDVGGQSPVIPFGGIELMLSEEGTHFYIENPKFSADDDIAVMDYYSDSVWESQADWDMWGVACWFTGKIADIGEMNYKETMYTSANVVSSSAVANMSDGKLSSIDVDVVFDDDHEMEFQITHAIVPAYEIDNGGGSDGGPAKAILYVIPLLLIVGMMFLVINFIMKRN